MLPSVRNAIELDSKRKAKWVQFYLSLFSRWYDGISPLWLCPHRTRFELAYGGVASRFGCRTHSLLEAILNSVQSDSIIRMTFAIRKCDVSAYACTWDVTREALTERIDLRRSALVCTRVRHDVRAHTCTSNRKKHCPHTKMYLRNRPVQTSAWSLPWAKMNESVCIWWALDRRRLWARAPHHILSMELRAMIDDSVPILRRVESNLNRTRDSCCRCCDAAIINCWRERKKTPGNCGIHFHVRIFEIPATGSSDNVSPDIWQHRAALHMHYALMWLRQLSVAKG